MRPGKLFQFFIVFGFLFTASAHAHFGMVIPSTNIIDQNQRKVHLSLSFSHPFEGIGMNLIKPEKFYHVYEGNKTDLLDTLDKNQLMNKLSWVAEHDIKRPGVYHFVMEPKPFWEPAEDLFIIHYTKTIIAAFGAEDEWDAPVGLPTEIVPLMRPFGNYAGNTFSGQVLVKGKPSANSEVEIEFYNREGKYTSQSAHHITQIVKTDANGVFHFTCSLPGWWGFAALSEADYTLADPAGKEKNVELGAVLWVYFDSMTQEQ